MPELNIFIGSSLAGFKSLQRSCWKGRNPVPLCLWDPSDLPEVSQCQQHYLLTSFRGLFIYLFIFDIVCVWQHLAPSGGHFTASILPKFRSGTVPSLRESLHIINLIPRASPTKHLIWFIIVHFDTFKAFTSLGKRLLWQSLSKILSKASKEALNFTSIMLKVDLSNKSRKQTSKLEIYITGLTQHGKLETVFSWNWGKSCQSDYNHFPFFCKHEDGEETKQPKYYQRWGRQNKFKK